MKPYRFSHQREIVADRYDNIVYKIGSYDDLVWQWEKGIIDVEMSFLSSRPRYLDFGCGTGRIISYVEDNVQESTGVDISSEMISRAQSCVHRSELLRADITVKDVLVGRIFDLITVFRVFLNSEPELRKEIMGTLSQKLSREGVMIFNIPGNTPFDASSRKHIRHNPKRPI